MSEPLELEEDIFKQVKEWVNDNDKKLKVLKRAVNYEEENSCDDCPFSDKDSHGKVCWNPTRDISAPPVYVAHLKSAPFIGVVYDSNNHTDLSIKDLGQVKDAIRRIEGKPDEFSQAWVDNKVNKSKMALDNILEEIEITDDEKEKIVRLTKEKDALEFWKDYIAPDVKYRDKVKKAILIMLASPEDAHGNKGRINVKIYGPPGTGKTSFKKYLKDKFGAVSIDGARVSKADLTYNKNSSELGKLPKAHKGILVIEEADEMSREALGSTLTSLGETGEIEIRDMKIPAETRGVMLSNFETKKEIIREWSPESLNRFDFVIRLDFLNDEDKNETLDWHYRHFRESKPKQNSDLVKKYIKIVRDFEPEIDEINEISDFSSNNIEKVQNVREGISIMNVAWTIARLNLRNVKLRDFKKAFNLLTDENRSLEKKFSSD